MEFVVTGVGYTGHRVMVLLPAGARTGIGRSLDRLPADAGSLRVDLDRVEGRRIRFDAGYRLLYTVAPARDATGDDPRLVNFLASLDVPPERLVYVSTSGVYGDRGGECVTEDDEPAPSTGRARRRLAAERLLERWCAARGSELIILRVPGIYGPGRLGLDRIRERVPVLAEAEAGPGNRIHVDDLAGCAHRALTAAVPAGVFNVGDGDHRSGTWFAQTVARLANLDPVPEVSRRQAEREFSAGRLSFLRESRRVDTVRMRTVLGFVPHYADAEAGIAASLDARVSGAERRPDGRHRGGNR